MSTREQKAAKRRLNGGTLERRGETFRYRVMVAGEKFSFTIRDAASWSEAADAANRKHVELEARARERRARRDVGLPNVIRMDFVLNEFEESLAGRVAGTRRSYGDSLKPFRDYFIGIAGNPAIEDVRARDIDAYMDWRRANRMNGSRPLHPRTVAKDRAVLHRIFALADRREYRQGNPVARTEMPKYDRRDPVILTADEYDRLLTECSADPMLKTYALVLGETGCRCESEALHLRWEDVDLDAGFIKFATGRDGHRTKTGKGRFTPISARLTAALREHFAAFRFSGSPWLFHHLATKATHTRGERIQSLRASFAKAAKRAKLPVAFRQHDLRHGRVTTWIAEGHNPVHVKEAVGHSDLRTTMGYTHLAREHLRSLVEPAAAPRRQMA